MRSLRPSSFAGQRLGGMHALAAGHGIGHWLRGECAGIDQLVAGTLMAIIGALLEVACGQGRLQCEGARVSPRARDSCFLSDLQIAADSLHKYATVA